MAINQFIILTRRSQSRLYSHHHQRAFSSTSAASHLTPLKPVADGCSTFPLEQRKIALLVSAEAVIIAGVARMTYGIFQTHKDRSYFVGIWAGIFNGIWYVTPLLDIPGVIQTQSVQYLVVTDALANFMNAALWTAYAGLKLDLTSLIPGIVGTISGLFQIIVYAYYSTPAQPQQQQQVGGGGVEGGVVGGDVIAPGAGEGGLGGGVVGGGAGAGLVPPGAEGVPAAGVVLAGGGGVVAAPGAEEGGVGGVVAAPGAGEGGLGGGVVEGGLGGVVPPGAEEGVAAAGVVQPGAEEVVAAAGVVPPGAEEGVAAAGVVLPGAEEGAGGGGVVVPGAEEGGVEQE